MCIAWYQLSHFRTHSSQKQRNRKKYIDEAVLTSTSFCFKHIYNWLVIIINVTRGSNSIYHNISMNILTLCVNKNMMIEYYQTLLSNQLHFWMSRTDCERKNTYTLYGTLYVHTNSYCQNWVNETAHTIINSLHSVIDIDGEHEWSLWYNDGNKLFTLAKIFSKFSTISIFKKLVRISTGLTFMSSGNEEKRITKWLAATHLNKN